MKRLLKRVQIHNCRKHAKGKCRYGFPKKLRRISAVHFERGKRSNKFKVLIKRNHRYLNTLNPTLSRVWRGNSDIQYCAEPHGVAQYVAYYTSKAEPFCAFLQSIGKAAARLSPTSSPAQVLKVVGNAAIGSRQVSLQEGVHILSRNMYAGTSCEFSMVSVAPVEERNRYLKSQGKLEELNDRSQDIFASGGQTYTGKLRTYQERPATLEGLNMHDFETKYHYSDRETQLLLLNYTEFIVGC
eukprot:Phypoly_transcript_17411.p1 GENE.Phypoly_transcript_17411~~Phypoly_transcript_17411.p1  ORF type:complete len:263 (+),score=24.65 Phypoly_transcript_17411:65-790(+)